MNFNISLNGAARSSLAALGLSLVGGAFAAAPAAPQNTQALPQQAGGKAAKPAVRVAAAGKGGATASAPLAAEPPERAAQDAWDIVPADKTLNGALARWAGAAGWQLLWELPIDYAVQVRTTVPGSFEEAVATVVTSMDSAEMPMKAVFYKGNKVLRIMSRGVQ